MSDVLTLAQAKAHLRVTQSNEDDTIQIYVTAATVAIRNRLNGRIPGEDLTTPNIPADIKAAAFLLIGGMYEQRSDKIVGTIIAENKSLDSLLAPYRKRMGI